MSFKESEMQLISVLGTAVVTAALFLPVLYLTEKADAAKTKFEDMESIEASVAFKKVPQKQPQKPTSQPEVKKDNTVSHDENKKPLEGCKLDSDCKPDEKCKDARCVLKKEPAVVVQANPKDPFAGIHHDDDNNAGKPVTQTGDFKGSEEGW